MTLARIITRPVGLSVLCSALLLSASAAEPPRVWSRGFHATYAHDGPSIGLDYLNQSDSDLVGTFSFENISGKRAKARTVVVDGVETAPKTFWPKVRYEARKAPDQPWQPIGESSVVGRPKKLTIKSGAIYTDLWVSLGIFKPIVGRYESGRIILSSGQSSEFQLQSLAPPEP